MVTLGVTDVPTARAFYERLGWTVTFTDGDIVMFQAGAMIVSIWWRDKLDVDGGVADLGGLWIHSSRSRTRSPTPRPSTPSSRKRSRPVRPSHASLAEKPFGYSGVFADPDGHTWEVAWVRDWMPEATTARSGCPRRPRHHATPAAPAASSVSWTS